MKIERPLDYLNSIKDKTCTVILKDTNEKINGTLLAFDIHINVVLATNKDFIFIRGDNILSIS